MNPAPLFRLLSVTLLALWLAACASPVELMGGLNENEANEILNVLYQSGIAGKKQVGKEGVISITVPSDKVAPSLALLRAQGLPRERQQRLGEIFKKDGLVSSPLEERARYIYSLAQELENTLARIDGVLAARVHIVLPEAPRFGEQGFVPASASVFIKHRAGLDLQPEIPQIRRMVQNSIPNLTAERVSIALVAAQPETAQPAANFNERVWFLEVAPASVNTLRLLLAVLIPFAFLGLLALVGALIWHRSFSAWLRERFRRSKSTAD